jgi:peptide/nickel transport system substrate-binding protein
MKSKPEVAIRFMSVFLILAVLLTACSPAATTTQPEPVQSDSPTVPAAEQPADVEAPAESAPSDGSETLKVVTPNDTQTLDPAVNYDFSGGYFLLNCYEGLVKAEGSNEAKIVPALAESWEISDDGLEYTFHLRKNVKFHDGSPMDAEAVKFSFERLLAMKMGAVANFTSIDSIETPDENTVKFVLSAPFSSFLSALTSMWGPLIVSPTAVKAHEVDGDLAQAWMTDNIAGTGPFMLKSWDRNQQLVLVRNPDYWGGWGDKYLEEIIIRFVPETTTMRLMLEKGDADLAVGMSSNEDLDAIAQTPGLVVEEFTAPSIHDLRINTTKAPLDNIKVRQALAYSFDYDTAANGVLGGHAIRMDSITAKGVDGYYKPSFMYTKDLEKAKALLAEAGYPDGGFSLDYIWLSGIDIDRQLGEMWQADLKSIGIDLKIQEMPLNTWWEAQGNPETAPQMMMGQWGLDYADATSQAWVMYYSGSFPPAGSNYYYYKNADVDTWLEQARMETDKTKRDALYQQAYEQIYSDSPEIWAVQINERIAHSEKVVGYQYNLSYYKEGIEFHNMYKN